MKQNYAMSCNLLCNDIQNFANFLRIFRNNNKQWFENTDESVEKDDDYVPVAAALSSGFY